MDTHFDQLLLASGEYGIAYQVSHPIVFIEGLPTVKTHEVILFETGQRAEVFAINRGKIEARIFSHEPVTVGTKVTKTNQILSIPVGPELLGHTIDPLGDPLDPAASGARLRRARASRLADGRHGPRLRHDRRRPGDGGLREGRAGRTTGRVCGARRHPRYLSADRTTSSAGRVLGR